MFKVLAIVSAFWGVLAYAGGPVCNIDDTAKKVSAFTPNGKDWTMKYFDGTKDINLGAAILTASSDNGRYGYTLTASGAEAGILTVHRVGGDGDNTYGFFTRVSNGIAETSAVTCIEYQ